MAAGKHIYCDKPLAVGEENLARVEAALRGFRCTGQMALQYRFFPATLRAKQLVEAGFVGNVVSFGAAYLHLGSVDPGKPMGMRQLFGKKWMRNELGERLGDTSQLGGIRNVTLSDGNANGVRRLRFAPALDSLSLSPLTVP